MAKFNGTVNNIEDNRNKVTSIGENPTNTEYPSAQAVKNYVDENAIEIDDALNTQSSNPLKNSAIANALNTKLSLSGGGMQGAIAMGGNKITSSATPTAQNDLTNKSYVDGYAVKKGTESGFGVAAGGYANASGSSSVAVGYNATATNNQSVAIGYNANSTSAYAVQLGEGTNNDIGTLQFGRYQLCDNYGKIPNDRINIETVIDENSTDGQIPSALAVKTYVDEHGGSGGGIPMSYLVTSISSSSTNAQVPSAKCVYDAIQDALYVDTSTVIIPAEV